MFLSPFSEHFRDALEYWLCEMFRRIGEEELKGFWCDGVLHPALDTVLKPEEILKNRRIETVAFVGKTRQEQYDIVINLGRNSLKCYIEGRDLVEYLPSLECDDCLNVNINKHLIEIWMT